MSGHVFVVHGDLLKISADAFLIPCDASGEVLSHWAPFGPCADPDALADELSNCRVSAAKSVESQLVRYVDTGADQHSATAEWLAGGVRSGLEAAISDVAQRQGKHRRARPLVAMPLFGVGEGGFDSIRGAALQAQLRAAQQVVDRANADVVIVCFQRSDFAAIQLQRSPAAWDLPDELRRHADSLAGAIKTGRLVLFLGAGVSDAAGIQDFGGLVAELERRAGIELSDDSKLLDLPERVAALEGAVQDKKWISDQVADLVKRDHYSLTHGLLASLRVREAITTNFDRLYELACERPFVDAPLEVLPWQRSAGQNPWLLKAHGDPARNGALVLAKPSFDSFESDRATTAGVVRAMFALSREVLFVGYSLKDKNIAKLVDEATSFHRSVGVEHDRLGTIIDIESTVTELTQNPARLGIQLDGDASLADSALRLQVLLDYVLWAATREESSWLLDERYAALHTTDDERRAANRLAAQQIPSSGNWPVVERRLHQFGKRGS